MSREAADFGRLALEFVDKLKSLRSRKEVLGAVESALGAFGFDYYVMSDLPFPFQKEVPQVFGMKVPIGWAEHYVKSQYYLCDPVMQACREAAQPFEWSEVRGRPLPDARGSEVMMRANDFGLTHGFTLPIRNLNGRTSCFSMSSSDRPFLNRFSRPAIHLMALYAFERLRELDMEHVPEKRILTPRETEVLTWAAAGKSAASIAEVLGISERTVIAHTVNAIHKLGATNKTQAVALALNCHLIEL